MKDKKLQVFVSSTYIDLREERQAAVEAILSSGHIPAGMELFAAGDESQMTVIERWIDESDVYLLILGGRYGSVDKKTGKSYTQLEYEYAFYRKKPLFAVVISDKALEEKVRSAGTSAIEQESPQKLKEFRTIVLNNLVKFWDDKKDIKIAIHETLSDITYRKDLAGWIRGDSSVNTAFLAEEIGKLTKENFELRAKLKESTGNVLYSNLTYEQWKNLLERESVVIEENSKTIFQILLDIGQDIANEKSISKKMEPAIEKLLLYKLIKLNNQYLGMAPSYEFTNDGHSFYLKALLLNPIQINATVRELF